MTSTKVTRRRVAAKKLKKRVLEIVVRMTKVVPTKRVKRMMMKMASK